MMIQLIWMLLIQVGVNVNGNQFELINQANSLGSQHVPLKLRSIRSEYITTSNDQLSMTFEIKNWTRGLAQVHVEWKGVKFTSVNDFIGVYPCTMNESSCSPLER